MPPLTITPMTTPELALALDWAAAEGWNPGLQDARPFHAADPAGFLMARLAGSPVAIISAVRYGDDFGFVGLYIARPDSRGQGYGWATWQAGMRCLEGRTVGLDGVIAQQDNYRKSGFELHHRNIRYQGLAAGPDAATVDRGQDIISLSELPFGLLNRYDLPFFPSGRADFLAEWIHQPGSRALGLLANGALTGYGVIRPCRTGYKIGPLFADHELGANALFAALSAAVAPTAPIFLDVPECTPAALRLAERHGMTPMFETARMYKGPAPAMSLARTYGITTFELG